MEKFQEFYNKLDESFDRNDFVKITLSKPLSKQNELVNVYIRFILLSNKPYLSFTYRYKTNDQVKNYEIEEAKDVIADLLTHSFRFGTLFSLKEDTQIFINKKKKVTYKTTAPAFKNKPPETHDQPKHKRIVSGQYLNYLGVIDKDGKIIPKMADKYRQINKYIEIIDDLVTNSDLPETVHIVDMGSGKGYLTFALYDFLKNQKGFKVEITGIELRQNLVDYCNDIADKCNFKELHFECKSIQDYNEKRIDILIALHACDTATDDAIYKGMQAKSEIIVTAPCCHKQIRQHLKGKEQESPILKYGIYKEREYEMLTDTMRALLMEKENYQTKIFEFVSNEHTRKNVMMVGKRSHKQIDLKQVDTKLTQLKSIYGVTEHYLEELMKDSEID
jgi:methylase of polypeptide subunit release factors